MKVFVYYNLHLRLFSVRAMEGASKGRVIAHTASIQLERAVFKVSAAGRQRVLQEQRKNVHAGVVGHWCAETGVNDSWQQVTYNPYKYSSFVMMSTSEPIHSAGQVFLQERKIWVN